MKTIQIRFKAGTPKETVFKALKNIAKRRKYSEIQTYEFIGGYLLNFSFEQVWTEDDRFFERIAEDCHEYV